MADAIEQMVTQLLDLDRRVRALERQGTGRGIALIEEKICTSSSATITFSDIPSSFRTLVMVCQARTDRAAEADGVALRFNGDSGNSYDYIYSVIATGGVTTTASTATNNIPICTAEGANSRANCFATSTLWFPGYSSTVPEKFATCPDSGPIGNLSAVTDLQLIPRRGHWRSSVAVTSIALTSTTSSNFVTSSVFSLYGLS